MAVVRAKSPTQFPAPKAGLASIESLLMMLRDSGIQGVPLPIHDVAEFLGLEVFEELMDDDISGFLEFREGRWVIGVNALHHPNRQRFTIAHEIGHYVLHRQDNSRFVDETFARRQGGRNNMENAADRFAAELLMPESELHRLIREGTTSLEALATRFRVSTLAMRYRVKNLGYALR